MSIRRMLALRATGALIAIALCALAASIAAAQSAGPATSAGIEFFESRVRPVLAEHCYACHSEKKERSGLRLDRLDRIVQGGDRGPAVVPGQPDESPLVVAIRYSDDDLRMPPKGKLADSQIADLAAWVKMGAPLPAATPDAASPAPQSEFVLAERRMHWAYQPVQPVEAPAVQNAAWCTSPIDQFILSKLEAAGLSPAPPAERHELLRRVTFDLTGLPPTPAELAAFLADDSPGAFARVVDRLLESPHYGERWARHWLDLVRYCETWGFEFDFDLYNAWRYRDYVIRALNADLPYDRFVVEHLAGDLLPQPRRHPTEGFNESILATGFFWMGEGRQSPIDIRQEQADRIDNQIDVLSKAFLAQTIACARCHDHKFDAIATQDYYSLVGYLRSSRFQQAFIDSPDRIREPAQRLQSLKEQIREQVVSQAVPVWLEQAKEAGEYLLAARHVITTDSADHLSAAAAAQRFNLDPGRLSRWAESLQQADVGDASHPLFAWAQLANARLTRSEFDDRRQSLQNSLQQRQQQREAALAASRSFADFQRQTYEGWFVTGDAFGAQAAATGEVILGTGVERPVAGFAAGGAHSGQLSDRLQGELRSPTFTIERPFVHLRLAGRSARVNLIIDGYTLLMRPMYGGLTVEAATDVLQWKTIDVSQWRGHRAYFELSDSTIPMHRLNPPPSTARPSEDPSDAYLCVTDIRFSDEAAAPPEPATVSLRALRQSHDDAEGLAAAYQDAIIAAINQWKSGGLAADDESQGAVALLNWLMGHGLLDGAASPNTLAACESLPAEKSLETLLAEFRSQEAYLPNPLRAPALADGTGEDEFISMRGNYQTPGPQAPRQAPIALCGEDQPRPTIGSGRLELAERLVDPANPLLARVLVNRVWRHHFGEGIVRTPDDFGRMGQPPTHPELLDYLAAEFVHGGWSLKQLHQQMLLTSAYQMSSQAEPAQMTVDPENRLLHYMPRRRLEAEAIRDTLLAVSGQLNDELYGASILPYLTPHMEGRGRPVTGPLDSEGRRSIYINSRRNFLTPMLLAFDYPVSFGAVGRRGVSTVPAQALTLMNDPFVVDQARHWAKRALDRSDLNCEQRIESLYLEAFARRPQPDEARAAARFLEEQSRRFEGGLNSVEPWADLCHVLFNVKEFIFVD